MLCSCEGFSIESASRAIEDVLRKKANEEIEIFLNMINANDRRLSELERIVEDSRKYISSTLGTYRFLDVRFIEDNFIAENESGCYLAFLDIALVSSKLSGSKLEKVVAHESLHGSARGFAPRRLNEGMTEFLAIMYLLQRSGENNFATYSKSICHYYAEYSKELERKGETRVGGDFEGVFVIARLADSIGLEPLLQGYRSGDESRLLDSLGEKWGKIKTVAYNYDGRNGFIQAFFCIV